MKLPKNQLALYGYIINLAFGLYHSVLGVASHSWWFITIGVYYVLLAVMRFALLRLKRKKESEQFAKRFIGALLLFLALCLAGSVILAATDERGSKHHEIVMITIAVYAFTKITLAIIHLVRAKKEQSPLLKALRSVSMADAMVSIVTMQRSMLVTFEGMEAAEAWLMNLFSGSAACIGIFILGINLIGGKKIEMAKSKIVEANKKIAEGVVGGYKKIEKGVVDGYKKIETGVVDGYTKIEDQFVDRYLKREDETIEEAKKRLRNEK